MTLRAVPGPNPQQPLIIGTRKLREHGKAVKGHLEQTVLLTPLLNHPQGKRSILVEAVDDVVETQLPRPLIIALGSLNELCLERSCSALGDIGVAVEVTDHELADAI